MECYLLYLLSSLTPCNRSFEMHCFMEKRGSIAMWKDVDMFISLMGVESFICASHGGGA